MRDIVQSVAKVPDGAVMATPSAVLVGIGLVRFAHTPAIAALIAKGWSASGTAAHPDAAKTRRTSGIHEVST